VCQAQKQSEDLPMAGKEAFTRGLDRAQGGAHYLSFIRQGNNGSRQQGAGDGGTAGRACE